MPKPEYEFFDPTERMQWTPIEGAEGLEEIVLSKDEESGDYTRILRFAPGCDTTPLGEQRHEFWEEVWIVSGGIHDLGLDQTFVEGMYACRPPGMPHGPWRSDNGCITFETRYYKDA
jgi:hypothetical protein